MADTEEVIKAHQSQGATILSEMDGFHDFEADLHKFTGCVRLERLRQIGKWGYRQQPQNTQFAALAEEVGEVAQAVLEQDPAQICKELIEVAAICMDMRSEIMHYYGYTPSLTRMKTHSRPATVDAPHGIVLNDPAEDEPEAPL